MDTLLVLKDVKKTFSTPDTEKGLTVLDGVDFELAKGEAVSIVGPSGSGKSTLLNIMGALDVVTCGTVTIEGKNPADLTEDERSGIRANDIGFIFQLHHLLPQCTALENVLLPVLALEEKEDDAEQRAMDLLKKVGLEDRAYYTPARLSGGESQRVAVVRSLINSPKLILADEPTGSLDHENAAALVKLLKELVKESGTSLVMVTHSLELAKEADKIFELKEGKLNSI